MENINNESTTKKFTKENPCECGYPNSIDHHQENCIHYGKEGKEFSDAETENEEKNISSEESDEEYAKSRIGSYVESPVIEEKPKKEEPEDLWGKEAEELLKDVFIKKEKPKLEISKQAEALVKKIWDLELKGHWGSIIKRKDALEYVRTVARREIDSAIKEGRLPSDKDKEVLDTIELKCVEAKLPGCEIIIRAKSSSYIPMESTTEERLENLERKIEEKKNRE